MTSYHSKFKNTYSFLHRQNEAKNILYTYPGRIPVICEKSPYSQNTPSIDKNKYLVPQDLTIGQFIYIIRRRIRLQEHEALYLLIGGNIIPSTSELISNLYSHYRSQDLFLYLLYSTENTFG